MTDRHDLLSVSLSPSQDVDIVVEVDDGAAWVMIRAGGVLTAPDAVFYLPGTGWRLRSVDPRGVWPHITPMSAEATAHHLIVFGANIRSPDVGALSLVLVLARALEDVVPLMEAAVVMGS